jgi:predicted metal-dependent hydrolase
MSVGDGRRAAGEDSDQRRLFKTGELRLRRTGEARFREMAAGRRRSLSEREARAEADHEKMERLRGWAETLAPRFRLRYASIEAEDEAVTEHFGVCYGDGVIRIRLRHAVTGRHLKESSLVDTLCHELAHLRYMDHSIRFQKLYHRILEEARRRGIYNPGPVRKPGPVQCGLFDGETR